MSPRRRRRALVLAGGTVLLLSTLPLLRGGGSQAGARAANGVPVLVLDRPVAAGQRLDPANLRLVRLAAAVAPQGAIGRVEDAAFREAVVSLPPRLPLVASLLRRPEASATSLGSGERAVGVRVDDVTGLPALVRAGARVDVLVSVRRDGAMATARVAENAEVLERRAAGNADGSWAVSLRVPVAAADRIADAQADGREVRLLARGGRS